MPILPPSFDNLNSNTRRFVAILSIVVSATGLSAQSTPRSVESKNVPKKDYRLFVGLDLTILHQEEFGRLTNYRDHRAQLDGANGAVVDVRAEHRTRFEHVPKVGLTSLNISEVDTHRDYSVIDNSSQNWAVQQATVESGEAKSRLTGDLKTRSNPSGRGQRNNTPSTFYEPSTSMDERIDVSQNADIQIQLDEKFYADDGKQTSKDKTALVVEALLSSRQPIVDAYAVGIVRVVAQAQQKDLILFEKLEYIGPEPQRVLLRKESLPRSLEVLEVDIHIYRGGREFVTNMSDKQFGLSRDEAHEYVTLDRMAQNRNATLAAEPAWEIPPAALLAADAPEAFDYTFKVSVDDRGRIVKISEDAILPDHIRSIVEDITFMPALVDGQAVASEVSFNLQDFFR